MVQTSPPSISPDTSISSIESLEGDGETVIQPTTQVDASNGSEASIDAIIQNADKLSAASTELVPFLKVTL